MSAVAVRRAERRRDPRILWHIPFVATWNPRKTVTVREYGTTEVVNAHGALIRLSSNLKAGQPIDLQAPRGKPFKRARVVANLGAREDGHVRLGIELDKPDLDFWVEMAR